MASLAAGSRSETRSVQSKERVVSSFILIVAGGCRKNPLPQSVQESGDCANALYERKEKCLMRKLVLIAVCVAVLSIQSFAMAADVLVTKNGTKYHKETCALIKNRQTTAIDEKAAIEKGLKPCAKCFTETKVEDKSAKKSVRVASAKMESKTK